LYEICENMSGVISDYLSDNSGYKTGSSKIWDKARTWEIGLFEINKNR